MYAEGMPTLCIGLRGLIYMEVEATGPARDLHSGLYGGAAPNAVFGLIELLAKAKNADGVIQIPGIYDDVDEPARRRKSPAGRASRSRRRSSWRRKLAPRNSPASPGAWCWSASGRGPPSKSTASPEASPAPAPRR